MVLGVALIVIGPKDFPVAVRTITGLVKKARGMASEFQGHVDEMMREANIADVAGELKKATSITRDIPAHLAKTLDRDGLLRASIKDMDDMLAKAATGANPAADYVPPAEVQEVLPDAPRFIPPEDARKQPMPAFIPPGTKRWGF